jgi:hypothetical protein
MFGVEAGVLRAISAPWAGNPCPPPITLAEVALRLDDAQRLAGQLNNTNVWEQAITGVFSPDEIPRMLPTSGVPRPANHNNDNKDQK